MTIKKLGQAYCTTYINSYNRTFSQRILLSTMKYQKQNKEKGDLTQKNLRSASNVFLGEQAGRTWEQITPIPGDKLRDYPNKLRTHLPPRNSLVGTDYNTWPCYNHNIRSVIVPENKARVLLVWKVCVGTNLVMLPKQNSGYMQKSGIGTERIWMILYL